MKYEKLKEAVDLYRKIEDLKDRIKEFEKDKEEIINNGGIKYKGSELRFMGEYCIPAGYILPFYENEIKIMNDELFDLSELFESL